MFQLRSQKLTKEVIFDEANPVTLQALKTRCLSCGFLLVAGAFLFLAEGFGPIRHKFEGWLVSVRNVSFRRRFRRKLKRNQKLRK